MNSYKILIFNWRCWANPEMGGAEVFTHEIASRLSQLGHGVTLFSCAFPNCEPEEHIDGVRVIRAGGRYSVYQQAKKYYNQQFKNENFDFIIDEINTRPFFTPSFAKNGEKIIALIHQMAKEYWFYETPFPVDLLGYHFLEEKWLKQYAEVPTVTVSNSTKQDLQNLGFKQVYVISEGLNFKPLSKVPAKENHPVIVYAGRLKRAKRPDHAIAAFKILKRHFPEAKLWIIGDGPFRSALERMAPVGVTFFGALCSAERRALMRRAWILVNPSVREGWGLNVMEAAALGVPSVAYNVAGLRDAIKDGSTGLLVENANVSALAKAMLRLIMDRPFREVLTKKALQYANGFSWDTPTLELLNILEAQTNS